MNPHLYQKLPYDVARDYAAILQAAIIRNCLVVHPSLPVKSVKELVALAKARPGQLNYASGGVGSAQHVPMEMLKSLAGINIQHVPYKGLTPAFNDVLAGEMHMIIPGLVTALPYHKNGRLRIIATTGATRTSVTPEIPTIAQAGVAGYEFDSWTGFIAPAGTPPAILSQLHGEFARISRLPDIRDKLTAMGFDVVGGTPEAFTAVIKDNNARLGKVIREATIKAE
jgi:tripartite-type tricarboxylate transporter receptor subunit TctC